MKHAKKMFREDKTRIAFLMSWNLWKVSPWFFGNHFCQPFGFKLIYKVLLQVSINKKTIFQWKSIRDWMDHIKYWKVWLEALARRYAFLRENLSHGHYWKIGMQVEIGMRDCLRNLLLCLCTHACLASEQSPPCQFSPCYSCMCMMCIGASN